jgi:RimJ/RimL family protein N-acetyltransferase
MRNLRRRLRRRLRPLRPVLLPIYRLARPAPSPTQKGQTPENAWRFVHQEPPDRRISVLEGRHPGGRVLVVATGPSARQVVPFDARLHERYDVVIALNGSVTQIEHIDYFVSVESQAHLWDWYHHPVPDTVQRCVSESGVRLARESGRPDAQADRSLLHLRHVYGTPVDIRHYRNAAGEEGLLVGPKGETRLGRGTVSLQAIHFASMLGASEIHLIGADLHFRGSVQHFYGQNEYGTHEVEGKRYHALDVETRMNPIEVTIHPRSGQPVETTLHFQESAQFIDEVARTLLPEAGITIVDFSDGLLSVPRRGDFATWMETGEIVEPAGTPDSGAVSGVTGTAAAPRVTLRAATEGDRDLILEWANDPVTRASSFHPGPIDTATHAAWFAARLVAVDSRIWVGEAEGRPVGQVRAYRNPDGRVEMGIIVAPEARGRRLAAPLLRAGLAAAAQELGAAAFVAMIRPDNDISLRLFRGAGFLDEGPGERAGIHCVVLVRAADGAILEGSPPAAA